MTANQTIPTVGEGVTMGIGSDRYPYTIVAVRLDGKEIDVQRDDFHRIDSNGLSERQDYEFFPNESGRTETLTLRKNGRYVVKGVSLRRNFCYWVIGKRGAYQDPSF